MRAGSGATWSARGCARGSQYDRGMRSVEPLPPAGWRSELALHIELRGTRSVVAATKLVTVHYPIP